MRWSIFPEIEGRFPAELFVDICGTLKKKKRGA
jgi:hypothetical protein